MFAPIEDSDKHWRGLGISAGAVVGIINPPSLATYGARGDARSGPEALAPKVAAFPVCMLRIFEWLASTGWISITLVIPTSLSLRQP